MHERPIIFVLVLVHKNNTTFLVLHEMVMWFGLERVGTWEVKEG